MLHWSVSVSLLAASIAALTDLKTRIIPNWLTLPLLVLAFVAHAIFGGVQAVGSAALGSLCCIVPPYFLFSRGALGGGDVKLFAALGALLGVRDGLELQLTAFALVCLYSVWCMAWNGRLALLLRASCRATLHLLAPRRYPRPAPHEGSHELPMGFGIWCATLAVALRGVL